MVAAFVALETQVFIWMLIAGILVLAFSGFMFYITRQTKKAVDREKQKQAQYEAEMAGQPQQPIQPTQPQQQIQPQIVTTEQQPQPQIITTEQPTPQQPVQQKQPTTASFCSNCGQKITPGVKFCFKCKAEIK
jgi:hypothetical protein